MLAVHQNFTVMGLFCYLCGDQMSLKELNFYIICSHKNLKSLKLATVKFTLRFRCNIAFISCVNCYVDGTSSSGHKDQSGGSTCNDIALIPSAFAVSKKFFCCFSILTHTLPDFLSHLFLLLVCLFACTVCFLSRLCFFSL